MTRKDLSSEFRKTVKISSLLFLGKWVLLAMPIGILAGSASALLLASLQWVTDYRTAHSWIIALLPLGGLVIGLTYHYWGQDVVKGNNQLLEEFHRPRQIIPLKMAPLVLFGTVATHLFGGSAGREGTAVQMGGAIADQFTKIFRLSPSDRRILLVSGISAGFASVFGTPLAGAVFALEVLVIGKMRYEALVPAFITAIIADYTCRWWPIGHSHYTVDLVPGMAPSLLFWALLAGLCFGLTALLFSRAVHFFGNFFRSVIKYPPFRPVLGGAVIALVVFATDNTRYLGLGLPVISEAFDSPVLPYDFILKLLFTTFTLGAGFKGGEVTPLFFIGATLGNALALFIPLPAALLAGMGFVAVFSGATNTPLACTVMGMELFGMESGIYIALACITAYLFSGHSGIYSSQIVGSAKQPSYNGDKGKTLHEIHPDKKR
ncbi:voltage-gated chloride channel family protein [Sinomicrobium soli]|uniref:voltage-gated chloride channel family protein n=1 Tax=Sinomicrobium sp. N-1-3-6 TaxID=2219864 RepID=UPI000DCEFBFE|nr:voltage-gated chloride channel family protein [Sinomicrobium sp. N-1-3-6]RAV30384.1 chloride channel protein [Sinomicrobium sp. N-1-3-6]